MVGKVSSIVTLVCASAVYMLALQSPNDPLLLFISGNPLISSLRLILLVSMLIISFKLRFRYKQSTRLCLYLGGGLVFLSILGLFYTPMEYSLYTYVRPLDYLLFLQAGLTYSLIGLTYQTSNRKLQLRSTFNIFMDSQKSRFKKLQTR